MRSVTITARKRDPRAYGVQKYSNNEPWNVSGGMSPNGVSATRYLRDTRPSIEKLSPLAAWLFENVPKYCGGKMLHFDSQDWVKVYNGRTKAEHMLHEASTKLVVGNRRFSDAPSAIKAAEAEIRMMGDILDSPQMIDSWLFDIIELNETDEHYWNRQAEEMIEIGTVRVSVGNAAYEVTL